MAAVPDGVSPSLLIASPQMHDPVFERTVVLVWHHTADDGAMGVVINRVLDHRLADVLQLDDSIDLTDYADASVAWGGPVEETSGTVLSPHGLPSDNEGVVLPTGIGITRHPGDLQALLEAGKPLVLCLGYAGWGPGQLDHEIEHGSWLFTDADTDLVFGVPPEERYDRALASLGLTASTVWMSPIDE